MDSGIKEAVSDSNAQGQKGLEILSLKRLLVACRNYMVHESDCPMGPNCNCGFEETVEQIPSVPSGG